ESMDDFFAQEWARSVFGLAVERLKQELEHQGKRIHFQIFQQYDIEEGSESLTYPQLAERFGIKPSDATNYLAYARREFRRLVLDQLRQMTASEAEFQREARSLFGVDVP